MWSGVPRTMRVGLRVTVRSAGSDERQAGATPRRPPTARAASRQVVLYGTRLMHPGPLPLGGHRPGRRASGRPGQSVLPRDVPMGGRVVAYLPELDLVEGFGRTAGSGLSRGDLAGWPVDGRPEDFPAAGSAGARHGGRAAGCSAAGAHARPTAADFPRAARQAAEPYKGGETRPSCKWRRDARPSCTRRRDARPSRSRRKYGRRPAGL
jgi:hypothetical protein